MVLSRLHREGPRSRFGIVCVDQLQSIINDLNLKVKEKTTFIERLKRNSVSFAAEVNRNEREILQELEEKSNTIQDLNQKIKTLLLIKRL